MCVNLLRKVPTFIFEYPTFQSHYFSHFYLYCIYILRNADLNLFSFCPIRAFVDARVQPIYGGTNEIMKELIARDIVSDK